MSKLTNNDPVLDQLKAGGVGKIESAVPGSVQTRTVSDRLMTPSYGMSPDQLKSTVRPNETVPNHNHRPPSVRTK